MAGLKFNSGRLLSKLIAFVGFGLGMLPLSAAGSELQASALTTMDSTQVLQMVRDMVPEQLGWNVDFRYISDAQGLKAPLLKRLVEERAAERSFCLMVGVPAALAAQAIEQPKPGIAYATIFVDLPQNRSSLDAFGSWFPTRALAERFAVKHEAVHAVTGYVLNFASSSYALGQWAGFRTSPMYRILDPGFRQRFEVGFETGLSFERVMPSLLQYKQSSAYRARNEKIADIAAALVLKQGGVDVSREVRSARAAFNQAANDVEHDSSIGMHWVARTPVSTLKSIDLITVYQLAALIVDQLGQPPKSDQQILLTRQGRRIEVVSVGVTNQKGDKPSDQTECATCSIAKSGI